MKDKQLRQQLADCLRYYKRLYEDWCCRPYKEVTIQEWTPNYIGNPTVQDLIDLCRDKGYSPHQMFLQCTSKTDWDGYPEDYVNVYVKEKCSDKEWFDDVTVGLSPQWQYDRYKQYLEMKKEFK